MGRMDRVKDSIEKMSMVKTKDRPKTDLELEYEVRKESKRREAQKTVARWVEEAGGIDKFIYNPVTLHHHGEKRDYHSDYTSTLWNRLVAHYLFGGAKIAQTLADNSKGRPEVIKALIHDILNSDKYKDHRNIIKKNTKVDLADWVKKWEV